MKKSLLATVAVVALLATPALADDAKKEGPAPAPAAQQKAPAEKVAPAGQIAPKAEMKAAPKAEVTGQATPKAEGAMKANEAPKAAETKKENEPAKMNSSQAEPKADTKTTPKASEAAKPAAEPKASEATKTDASKTNATKAQTTGVGASGSAGASVSLTTEQKTKIRTIVLKSAPRVTNVNFSISVGTAVPRATHVVVVPETIVEIHPAWRGFMYFVVNDEIIIVDPNSYEIVAVLDV